MKGKGKTFLTSSCVTEGFASAEATKGLSDRPLETFGHPLINSIEPKRRQVAAALSAAVTITKLIGNALTFRRNQL